MTNSSSVRWPVAMSAILAMTTLILALGVTSLGGLSSAQAENFCTDSNLAPYGSGGDRCFGASHPYLEDATVVTHERAGCVDIADGSNNLTGEWVCGSSGSAPGYAAIAYYPPSDTPHKGVIRNNNTANAGVFGGTAGCGGGTC